MQTVQTKQPDTLAGRLTQAMQERGLKQRHLSELVKQLSGVKLSQAAVHKIATGVTKRPNRLPDIARALSHAAPDRPPVSAEWLAYGEQHDETPSKMNGKAAVDAALADSQPLQLKRGAVPVTGTAQLDANGCFDRGGLEGGAAHGYLAVFSDDPDAYALRVRGDSLSPRIRHGEYVVLEPNRPPVVFEECLVETRDGHKMIKIFSGLTDGYYRFDSVNDAHGPMHVAAHDVASVEYVSAIVKHTRFFEP